MSLDTFMSLTPLNPYINTYDASSPESPWGWGGIFFFGCYQDYTDTYNLEYQYNVNEVVLGGAPASPSDQEIEDYQADIRSCPTMALNLNGYNLNTDNQYLMIFHLYRKYGYMSFPRAQFFVGTELVREEEIIGEEQVALLMDVTAIDSQVKVYVRMASDNLYVKLGIKGVDIFLL